MADLDLAVSSFLGPGSYVAGEAATLLLNLTDSFGNTITELTSVSALLNASTLSLSLRPDATWQVLLFFFSHLLYQHLRHGHEVLLSVEANMCP